MTRHVYILELLFILGMELGEFRIYGKKYRESVNPP